MNGWIKLFRSTIDNPKLIRANRLSLWIYILLSVNHAPGKAFLCGKEIELNPGQGVFSTPDLSKKLGVSVSFVRRSLDWLESEQQIEQQKTTKGTVITVVNWFKYQQSEQQAEQQMNNNGTTTEQQRDNLPIIEKEKEEKNERNIINNPNGLFVIPAEDEPEKNDEFKPVIDAWNSLPLKNIRGIKGKRLDLLRARIKEYGLDDVLHAISMIKNCPFLLGQNKKSWCVTIDWFLRPNNFPKVLEGNYERTVAPQGKNDLNAGYAKMMSILGGNDGNTD